MPRARRPVPGFSSIPPRRSFATIVRTCGRAPQAQGRPCGLFGSLARRMIHRSCTRSNATTTPRRGPVHATASTMRQTGVRSGDPRRGAERDAWAGHGASRRRGPRFQNPGNSRAGPGTPDAPRDGMFSVRRTLQLTAVLAGVATPAYALKPSAHADIANESCRASGLPRDLCQRIATEDYDTDSREWDDLRHPRPDLRWRDRLRGRRSRRWSGVAPSHRAAPRARAGRGPRLRGLRQRRHGCVRACPPYNPGQLRPPRDAQPAARMVVAGGLL